MKFYKSILERFKLAITINDSKNMRKTNSTRQYTVKMINFQKKKCELKVTFLKIKNKSCNFYGLFKQ